MKFDLTAANLALLEMIVLIWKISIDQNRKKSLYNHIKNDFVIEPYVHKIRNKRNRSIFARLRAGCLLSRPGN